jgi:hypothetical protein
VPEDIPLKKSEEMVSSIEFSEENETVQYLDSRERRRWHTLNVRHTACTSVIANAS